MELDGSNRPAVAAAPPPQGLGSIERLALSTARALLAPRSMVSGSGIADLQR